MDQSLKNIIREMSLEALKQVIEIIKDREDVENVILVLKNNVNQKKEGNDEQHSEA